MNKKIITILFSIAVCIIFWTGLLSAGEKGEDIILFFPFAFTGFWKTLRKRERGNFFYPFTESGEIDDSPVTNAENYFADHMLAVEIYKTEGSLLWRNGIAREKWGPEPENHGNTFLVTGPEGMPDPDFMSRFDLAVRGHSACFTGRDFHSNREPAVSDSPISVMMVPIFKKRNKTIAVTCIYIELPDLGEGELKQDREDQVAISLLDNVSHELRTPLNWIMGFADLVAGEQDIRKIREYNSHIISGAQLLLSSINNLIKASSQLKNSGDQDVSDFSVHRLIEEIDEIAANEVRQLEKEINIVQNLSFHQPDQEYYFHSDRQKIRHILMSLVNNSLKYTQSGRIELGCRQMPSETLLFYVKDTGIGISKDIQSFIFDFFRKGTHIDYNNIEGMGLGLSIARNYVNMLGGNIWIDSESGKGATFYFTVKSSGRIENLNRFEELNSPGVVLDARPTG